MSHPSPQHIEELLSLIIDDRGFVTEGDRDAVFRRLRTRLDNRQCFVCHNRNPNWLSMTYAIFICLTCSGSHRKMGTHISFVRSCELDKFKRDQLIRMELGGNAKALAFFKSHGIGKPDFESKLAKEYKMALDKACEEVLGMGHACGSQDRTCSNRPSLESSDLGQSQVPMSQKSPVSIESRATSSSSSSDASLHSNVLTCTPYASAQSYSSQGYRATSAGNSVGLGRALMTHASATGGLGSRQAAKGRKLDQEFDFDEAFDEASSAPVLGLSSPPVQPTSYSYSPSAPVLNVFPASPLDATNRSPVVSGLGSSYGSTSPSRYHQQSAASVPSLSAITNSRYATAKSISSAELFKELNPSAANDMNSERLEMNAKIRRFNDCKGISSEAFHAGDPTLVRNKNSHSLDSDVHLAQLGAQARHGIQVLASGAQQTVAKARDWFANFVFEDKRGGGTF